MSTLTMMERTATGWRCPRCSDTCEDDLLPLRAVECNCVGLDAFYEQLKTQGTNPGGPGLRGIEFSPAWPPEADLRRELLSAAIMWGVVALAVLALGVLLYLRIR